MGFGFVDYLDSASAEACVTAMNGLELPDGTAIFCSLKKPSTKGRGKGGKKGESQGDKHASETQGNATGGWQGFDGRQSYGNGWEQNEAGVQAEANPQAMAEAEW